MNIPSIISLGLVLGLCSCTTVSRNRVIKENGASMRYQLPKGWMVDRITPPADYFNVISPTKTTKPSDVCITIDFYDQYDPRYPQTQAGCASSYLEATQSHKDSAVQMSLIGSVHSGRYGSIAIYNYSSDYFGDHLDSFIVTHGGYANIELWATKAADRIAYTQAFEEVVRSLSVEPNSR